MAHSVVHLAKYKPVSTGHLIEEMEKSGCNVNLWSWLLI